MRAGVDLVSMVEASVELQTRQNQAATDALRLKQLNGDLPSITTVQDNSMFTIGSEPSSTEISRTNSKDSMVPFTPKLCTDTFNNSSKQEERKD